MWSLESGAESVILLVNDGPVRGSLLRDRFAIGRMHEVRNVGTDFVL